MKKPDSDIGWLAFRKAAWIGLVITLFAAGVAATEPESPPVRMSASEQREIKRLQSEFTKAIDPAARAETFSTMLAVHPMAASILKPWIEQDLGKAMTGYVKALESALGQAYLKQLEDLSQEQIDEVQRVRRKWMSYVLHGGDRVDFVAQFFDPCLAVGELILVKPEAMTDEKVAPVRARVLEFAGYLGRCDTALGIGTVDPTKGKVSKTGLPYPPLDQPPTFADNLRFLERTIVLSTTVAPPGARSILARCDEVAREIDVQETEFVLTANTIRMLVGQIAWQVDPMMTCCVRDHSNDRRDGKAEGHMSSVPGKHGFTDRAKLWGCPAASEGAGGGNDGVGYLRGLSYGGGHTGPLYSRKRNLFGVGRRDGVYTSMYATDKSLVHPTQATEGILFLPPGFLKRDVRGTKAVAVAALLARGATSEAASQLAKTEAKSATKKRDPYEEMLLRFFSGWVKADYQYFVDSLREVEQTGDLFDLKRRIIAGSQRFAGMEGLAEAMAPSVEKLKAPEASQVIDAGQAYHTLVTASEGAPDRIDRFRQFSQQASGTIYAEAAKAFVDSGGEKGPWDAIHAKHPSAKNFGWPTEAW